MKSKICYCNYVMLMDVCSGCYVMCSKAGGGEGGSGGGGVREVVVVVMMAFSFPL